MYSLDYWNQSFEDHMKVEICGNYIGKIFGGKMRKISIELDDFFE